MRAGCYTWGAFELLVPFLAKTGWCDRRSRCRYARAFLATPMISVQQPRPDSSVVERGPEKAGVGGSIPSLATTSFNNLAATKGLLF